MKYEGRDVPSENILHGIKFHIRAEAKVREPSFEQRHIQFQPIEILDVV